MVNEYQALSGSVTINGDGGCSFLDAYRRAVAEVRRFDRQPSGSLRGFQHTMPYIAKSAWHPVVHLVRTGDVVLVVLALAGQINSVTTMDLSLPSSGDSRTAGPCDATARAGLCDEDDDALCDILISTGRVITALHIVSAN